MRRGERERERDNPLYLSDSRRYSIYRLLLARLIAERDSFISHARAAVIRVDLVDEQDSRHVMKKSLRI